MQPTIAIACVGLIVALVTLAQRLGSWEHKVMARVVFLLASFVFIASAYSFLPRAFSWWPIGLTLASLIAWGIHLLKKESDEADEPTNVEPVDKWVELNYPSASGLQQQLEREGYRVAWCRDSKLTRKLHIEGWEIVVTTDKTTITKLRLKDPLATQTLIKKRSLQVPTKSQEAVLPQAPAEKTAVEITYPKKDPFPKRITIPA